MKKIIVLGANGQLGRTLRDIQNHKKLNFEFYTRRDLDILDLKSLRFTFKKYSFQYCINCAAYTNVEMAELENEKAFNVNAIGPKVLAEICNDLDVTLIHISTDYVFNGKSKTPYKENDSLDPINVYGFTKLQGELNVINNMSKYYIIRTSWLYSKFGSNFLKKIINRINKGEILNITERETGTPTNSEDLARFIFYIIESNNVSYGIYNFSARGHTTWYGFAREIVKIYDYKKIENVRPVDYFQTKVQRPEYSVLDLSKTEDVYKKLPDWQESVNDLISKSDFSRI